MLKLYHSRDDSPDVTAVPAVSSPAAVVLAHSAVNAPVVVGDGFSLRIASQLCARLTDSELLPNIPALLVHLCGEQQAVIVTLVDTFHSIFGDIPSRTTVLVHDVDVGDAASSILIG